MIEPGSDCKLISLIPEWDMTRYLPIDSGIKIERAPRWENAASADFKLASDGGLFVPKDGWRPLTYVPSWREQCFDTLRVIRQDHLATA